MKDEIIKLRKQGHSYNKISKELSCSKSTVSLYCSTLKDNDIIIKDNIIDKNKKIKGKLRFNKKVISQKVIDKVIELRKDNKTYKEIMETLNLNRYTVSKICKRYNLTTIKNKKILLSQSKIDEIVNLYNKLKSTRKVAKKLNITRYQVLKYVTPIERKKYSTEEERKKGKSEKVIEWRKRKKKELVEYKGGKCEMCGYNRCINALEFHHKDPNEKDFTISGKSWSFDRLKKEVDKCTLVCSNCHNEIHYGVNNPQ